MQFLKGKTSTVAMKVSEAACMFIFMGKTLSILTSKVISSEDGSKVMYWLLLLTWSKYYICKGYACTSVYHK